MSPGPIGHGGPIGPGSPAGAESATAIGAPGGWQPPEQGRFDNFRPEPAFQADKQARSEQPDKDQPPQVRNGRVLVAVLAAAALLLIVPFLIVWLATRSSVAQFNIGDCVKQSGAEAVGVDCGEAGAFKIQSKVDAKEKCANPNQPVAVLTGDDGKQEFLCLVPTAGG
jgi:hypothetical protein